MMQQAPPATVLVIEDETLVRTNAVATLEDLALSSLEAADGDEALRLLDAHPEVRVVFSDIHLPGRWNGMSLAQEVRRRYPAMGIILTSGMTHPGPHAVPSGGVFLPKPYLADDLLRALYLVGAVA